MYFDFGNCTINFVS